MTLCPFFGWQSGTLPCWQFSCHVLIQGWHSQVVCMRTVPLVEGTTGNAVWTRSDFSAVLKFHSKLVLIYWKTLTVILMAQYKSLLSPLSAMLCIKSLGPSDAIWRWSTLVQVMACCLTAPSHYLNQCWLIISKVLWHSSEDIIMRRFEDINQ